VPGRSIGWDLHTPDDPVAAPSHWQRYGFDGAGRLNAVSSPAGEYSYTYVEQSHLLASVTGPVHTVSNSYESGRDAMTSKTNAVASSTVSRFGARYDALGRRIETSRSGSAFAHNFVSGYQYDLLGQLISVVRTELSSGDGMEMVGEETDDNPLAPQAGLLQDASGGHGPMSTLLVSPLQSPLLPSTSLTERDARFEGSTPGAPDQKLEEESFSFLYDGIGNRLMAQKGNDTTAYIPNALNQYTDINGIEPVYDADGNLFSDGNNRFHWDAENRLTLVEPLVPTEGSKRLEFKYDYIGRRVSKQVWTHTGGAWTDESTTAFVYDGWNLIEEISTSSQTASINHYTWGLDLSLSLQGAGGVGGLLSVVCAPFTESGLIGDWLLPIGYVSGPAPSTFYYTFDLNGNVSELLDSTGSIAAHYEYGPFGELLVENYEAGLGTAVASFRFSTKYYDAELKTLYYGYRYYDPSHGRWLNRDPIEESGGLNLYGFVGNSPGDEFDYMGLWIVVRNGEEKADATAEEGDTIDTLAPLVGLDASDYNAWLTSEDRPMPSNAEEELCGKSFKIPNTIYAPYNGHFGAIGRWAERYISKTAAYERDGYLVLRDREGPVASVMYSILKDHWDRSNLQGLYYMGHGGRHIVNVESYYTMERKTIGRGYNRVQVSVPNYGDNTYIVGGSRWFCIPIIVSSPIRSDVVDDDRRLWDIQVFGIKRYGISHLRLDACHSAEGMWQELVSKNRKELVLRRGVYIPVIGL